MRDTAWTAAEFDRRAPTYDDGILHRRNAEHAALLLASRPGQRVLDLATGTGLALRACAGDRVGVDISAGMLRVAAARSAGRYVRADVTRLPFRDGTFDALLCVAAVPYLPDFARALTEWRRVARPGAVLVFTTPASDSVTALGLVREAARRHGIDVPDPHGDLGAAQAITARLGALGVTVDHIESRTFRERLGPDARAAFDAVFDNGFAEPLPEADRVFATFRPLYEKTRDAEHIVLYTRCRLTGP